MEEIVNRVANSSLLSIDMDDYLDQNEVIGFDIKDTLFQEMLLREKDFRQFLKEFDWELMRDKNVFVYCSVDVIIPSWAYMLLASKIAPVANVYTIGDENDLERAVIDQAIDKVIDQNQLEGAKVVVKGCGNLKNRDYAYFALTKRLVGLVSSIMYGEPCSTVPVYKKKA
ncbi:DUF2480 family protein [Marinoscillum sp. MHG1-6]|uniref:DUF2480 family protein n=1 Tax=Marinoscillum sp. MHG1-6 TaxID=2959627 RepID=UPI0021578936|nr:DUF2480 family protein [Marinoscillum sp. MHG1-6]